jgi:hypothetical protein
MSHPEGPGNNSWLDGITGLVSPMLVVSGILIYGALSIGAEMFYGQLGIDPLEVGLSYGGVLSHSTGFIIAIVLGGFITFVFLGIADATDYMRARGLRNRALELTGGRLLDAAREDDLTVDQLEEVLRSIAGPIRQRSIIRRRWVLPIAGMLLAFALLTLGLIVPQSYMAGRSVRGGKAVHSIGFLGVRVLTIRADRASIESASNQDTASEALVNLRQRSLLYLGQNDGIVVLYEGDPANRAIYLPASSIVLTVDHS